MNTTNASELLLPVLAKCEIRENARPERASDKRQGKAFEMHFAAIREVSADLACIANGRLRNVRTTYPELCRAVRRPDKFSGL